MRRHRNNDFTRQICVKCGMTLLQQMQWPGRACRPQISKRRAKKTGLPAYPWAPSPELTALSRRARMIDKTKLIGKGLPPEMADHLLDMHDKAMAEAVIKIFSVGTNEGPLNGLAGLIK